MKNIYISASRIDGHGVTAREDIKKEEMIQYIKGEAKYLPITSKEESLSYPNWIGIGKNKWIDPNTPNQYLNHSCEPNAGIKGSVTMIALKNIKKGEEITIDYSITEGDDLWEMKCSCGVKSCRKIIRSIKYMPIKQFNNCLPYIPTFFKKIYLKEHPKSENSYDPS